MLNITTFKNLVNLAQNTTIGSDARITITGQDARTGAATFSTTETNAFTRLGERMFRSDANKVAYGNTRAKLITTLTDLFGITNADHLPSAVRAAFVYGETACDRPLTQRRLKAVMTAAAQTLGYANLEAMKTGVEARHAGHLSDFYDMPKPLLDPIQNANVMIGGKRVSELTQEEQHALIRAETIKRFDQARDLKLDSQAVDSNNDSDDDFENPTEDVEYVLPGFDEVNANVSVADLRKMGKMGQEVLGYFNTVEDELRVAKDIKARYRSNLTITFEKVLHDPVKAAAAVKVLYGVKTCATGDSKLAGLLASIHNVMEKTVEMGTPDQVAKLAKTLAKLGDFDPADGASIHKLIKAYGHMKYVDDFGTHGKLEMTGKDVDYVDDLYAATMKRINANIKAYVDGEDGLSSAEKKTLVKNMTNLMMKLNPLGPDIAALSNSRIGGEFNRDLKNLDDALWRLKTVAQAKPDFNVNASNDTLEQIASQAKDGASSNHFQEELASDEEESDIKIFGNPLDFNFNDSIVD